MKIATFVIASILAGVPGGAGEAAAQPGTAASPPAVPTAPPAVPTAPPVAGERSEGVALGLSLGGTIATWGLLLAVTVGERGDLGSALGYLAGTYLAPTVGHWYAGSIVSRGLGVRTLGMAAMIAGYLQGEVGRCDGCDEDLTLLFWSGLTIYAAGTIDDIISAPRKVRRHNRRLAARSAPGFAIAPIATQHSAGLAIGGCF
jgi:hypothetical protein